MDRNKLAIGRIFWTDYTTFLSTVILLLFWGFFLFDRLIQHTALTDNLHYIAVIVTVAGVAAIAWRIRLIKSAFDDGWETTGIIESIGFFRDRGRVTYIYTIQGERYQSGNAIMKHRITKSLQKGQEVSIVANKDNPKIAFIRDLYT